MFCLNVFGCCRHHDEPCRFPVHAKLVLPAILDPAECHMGVICSNPCGTRNLFECHDLFPRGLNVVPHCTEAFAEPASETKNQHGNHLLLEAGFNDLLAQP